jgi:hypothetical protein
MEKEFVKYEQALALKELGFDEPVIAMYKEEFKKDLYPTKYWGKDNRNSMWIEGIISAPTYQQAFRWFRDEYNLVFNFISYSIVKPGEYHWSITWHDVAKESGIVKTYEEAESDCLDKLIEICKNK